MRAQRPTLPRQRGCGELARPALQPNSASTPSVPTDTICLETAQVQGQRRPRSVPTRAHGRRDQTEAAQGLCACNWTKGFIRDVPGSWPSPTAA